MKHVMKRLRKAGTLAALLFVSTAAAQPDGGITFVEHDDRIDVHVDGTRVTSYRYSCDGLKPCLWPVATPSGAVMTRGFPMEPMEGESTDHPHHTGVYFTFERVNGNNFWNVHDAPPEIRHVRVLAMEEGAESGTLAVLKHWVGADGKTLLEEVQTMRFSRGADRYAIDFSMDLSAVDEPVAFEDTKEGMFAIRVADWLTERNGTGAYLSSNGDRTEKNIWGRRAEWVRLEGEREGRVHGVAIMNHPGSVNFPTYWHARGYGCFSANPLGQLTFQEAHDVPDPEPFGLTLQPGETAPFKFRMLVYDGPRTQAQLDRVFRAYRSE